MILLSVLKVLISLNNKKNIPIYKNSKIIIIIKENGIGLFWMVL